MAKKAGAKGATTKRDKALERAEAEVLKRRKQLADAERALAAVSAVAAKASAKPALAKPAPVKSSATKRSGVAKSSGARRVPAKRPTPRPKPSA